MHTNAINLCLVCAAFQQLIEIVNLCVHECWDCVEMPVKTNSYRKFKSSLHFKLRNKSTSTKWMKKEFMKRIQLVKINQAKNDIIIPCNFNIFIHTDNSTSYIAGTMSVNQPKIYFFSCAYIHAITHTYTHKHIT